MAVKAPEKKDDTVKIPIPTKVAEARKVVDAVATQARKYIESGELIMPKDYDVNGALKSAWLTLQEVKDKDKRPALEVCTKNSVANALLDMIVQGLNPRKKQCAFVVFGQTLVLMREYFGSMAIAERVNHDIKDWGSEIVYEGDKISYDIVNGKKVNIKHSQNADNIDNAKIIGAYAMPLDKDGNPIAIEYMTIEQLYKAWSQSPMKPFTDKGELEADSTHGKFPADMARRTVINKVAKFIINRSSDNHLLLDRINRSQEIADQAEAQIEIEANANTGDVIDFEPEPERPQIEHEQQGEDTPEPEGEQPEREAPDEEPKEEKQPKGKQPGF